MKTKTKAFDCVAESRTWRERASAKLNAMSTGEELAYLQALGERTRVLLGKRQAGASETLVLREEPPEAGREQD